MVGQGGDWQNDRLETTYNEARTVLDSQQAAIQDIDNKSMFTNRVIVIFIGIVIAAARLGDGGLFNPLLVGIGALLLFVSFAVGVKDLLVHGPVHRTKSGVSPRSRGE